MVLLAPESFEVGVDESGRGTLWGDVVAAAVILPTVDGDIPEWMCKLNDSKKLSAKARATLAKDIIQHAVAWSVGVATPEEIDECNILRATMIAMHRALDGINSGISKIYVDGTYFIPYKNCQYVTVPGGDAKRMSIAAASILAKEHRDSSVLEACKNDRSLVDNYCMDRHKGYGTQVHMSALKEHGAHPKHRKTFAPVTAVLNRTSHD